MIVNLDNNFPDSTAEVVRSKSSAIPVRMTQVTLAPSSDHRIPQKRRSCDDDNEFPGHCRRPKIESLSRNSPSANNARRFACPFYIASPENFYQTTCAHGSWRDIPRLKEHLYRRHYHRRITCERCSTTFPQEKELFAHRRQTVPCQIAEIKVHDPIVDGMKESTMNMLKSRKRSSTADDEEKWFEIWDAVFPDREKPESPCQLSALFAALPHLQLTWPDAPDMPLQKADAAFAAYLKQHLQAEVPRLLKQNLEGSVVTKLDFDAVGDIISAWLDSAVQQYAVQSGANTPPAASIQSEVEAKARPSIPLFSNTHTSVSEHTRDFRLFSDDPGLSHSPRHITDDSSTPYTTVSRTSTATFIDTPYSTVSDADFPSQPWSDMPSLMPFDVFNDPENTDIRVDTGYQFNIDNFDLNFAPVADRPDIFSGRNQP